MAGVASLTLAALVYFVDPFVSGSVLPTPVALGELPGASAVDAISGARPIRISEDGQGAGPTPIAAGFAVASATPVLAATAQATTQALSATPLLTVTPTLPVMPTATATPTATAIPKVPGVPIRMEIAAIEVDSDVREAGTYWERGQLLWETLPFVVAHYRATALAGEQGNAVFAGHVTSRAAGNVFSELHRIRPGDEIRIHTEDDEFTYVVSGVRLVLPNDTGPMDPAADGIATLITCAGEWVASERNYTHRLIVTARLKI